MKELNNNTVIISLEEYNRLRDFELKITEGNTLFVYTGYGTGVKIYNDTSTIKKKIKKANKGLRSQLEDVDDKIKSLCEYIENKMPEKKYNWLGSVYSYAGRVDKLKSLIDDLLQSINKKK